MRRFLTLVIAALSVATYTLSAQKYPIYDYDEPHLDTKPNKKEWREIPRGLQLSWASRDVHYVLHDVPDVEPRKSATIYAWRGERANVQAVMYSKHDEGELHLRMTEWQREDSPTGIRSAEARFVNYAITDDYKACGDHPKDLAPWLVPDVIDIDKPHNVKAMECRPV